MRKAALVKFTIFGFVVTFLSIGTFFAVFNSPLLGHMSDLSLSVLGRINPLLIQGIFDDLPISLFFMLFTMFGFVITLVILVGIAAFCCRICSGRREAPPVQRPYTPPSQIRPPQPYKPSPDTPPPPTDEREPTPPPWIPPEDRKPSKTTYCEACGALLPQHTNLCPVCGYINQ